MTQAGPAGPTATERIEAEAASWPGVEVVRGGRGELSIRLGRRELGHLHGDRLAHFGFPRPVWAELLEQGRVGPHPIDQPGWAERQMREPADVMDVIELLRLNYDRIVARHGVGSEGRKGEEPERP